MSKVTLFLIIIGFVSTTRKLYDRMTYKISVKTSFECQATKIFDFFSISKNLCSSTIMAVEKLKLNNGYEMPAFGLGTMYVSNSFFKMPKQILRINHGNFDLISLKKRLVKTLGYKRSKMLLTLDTGILIRLTYM